MGLKPGPFVFEQSALLTKLGPVMFKDIQINRTIKMFLIFNAAKWKFLKVNGKWKVKERTKYFLIVIIL